VPSNSSSEEQFLKKLTELTEANLNNEQFGVSELAREMGMSRSNLHRRLFSLTKLSASQFIRQLRLKKAMEMLRHTALNVSEVAYMVGFGSVTYFTKCFHDYYGFPPGEVGKRNTTEPRSEEQTIEVKQVQNKKGYKSLLIHTSLLITISATFLILFFKPFSLGKNTQEKTIAVLPFIDYSPKEGNSYIINGLRDEILDKLEKIQDLKVKSRTDVEKYKNTMLGIREIANDLNVNYILEGSGQKFGDKIRIRLQLIETASGNHLWSKPYEEEVNDETIFDIQEEVALTVAHELGAVIQPEEKSLLIKKPTQNPEAYTLYLRGLDYLNIHNYKYIKITEEPTDALKAKQCFEQAIKIDSTFSEAYIRLAHIYQDVLFNSIWDKSIKELYLDSGMMMINKVFLYDTTSNWAYSLRGTYYSRKGMLDKANEDFDKAFELSPKNEYTIYYARFWQYIETDDHVNALKYFYLGMELQPKEVLTQPGLLISVSVCLANLGYLEIAQKYLEQYLIQTKDSFFYYNELDHFFFESGDFKAALDCCQRLVKIKPSDKRSGRFAKNYLFLRNYSEAYKYTRIEEENELTKLGKALGPECYFGYIYLKNGQLKKANYHLNGQLKYFVSSVASNRPFAQQYYSQMYLASIYAALGEKEKAIENIKMLKKRKANYKWLQTYVKYFPLLDNIRNEPEFAEVLKDVEAKYQKTHLRAGELIKEYERR
jgi:TolB-like protein/AraC-like DNA-binding protein/Tfp pilus assembly protein PilF